MAGIAMLCSQLDADPDGDLVLLLGPDEVAIRVCSKLLSRVSPVFAAMSRPHFAEGQLLRTSFTNGAAYIMLPEDDASAMIHFCRALHLNLNINEEIITFEICLILANLCDKYDASRALGSWSQLWMNPWKDSLRDETPFYEPLYIARAFNNHRVFWSMTRDIMRYYSTDTKCFIDELTMERLPDRLIDAIDDARGFLARKLQDTIGDIMAPYFESSYPNSDAHRAHQGMYGLLTISGHYFRELARLKVWPSSRLLHSTSPALIAERLAKFELYDVTDPENRKFHQKHFDCMIRCEYIDCKKLLNEAAAKVFNDQEGLCLSCINAGKVTMEDGNCRAAEESKCTYGISESAVASKMETFESRDTSQG